MELSCLLGTTRHVLQEKFPQKPYNESFIDRVCSFKRAGYWPRSFLGVYGLYDHPRQDPSVRFEIYTATTRR